MLETALLPVPPFRPAGPVHYPDDDGQPVSDNTFQFQWIMTIQGGLDALFADREDVFVAGDLLWYPVENNNTICAAPDAMVVFGRPKGPRGSHRQWEEGGIAPQVVFEVPSPSNRFGEMARKLRFYDEFGVEEYYLYDPGDPRPGGDPTTELLGWRRPAGGGELVSVRKMDGWRSPRLGIVFELDQNGELRLIRPDCRPFETFVELSRRAEAVQRHVERVQQRADRLAERLRAAGIDPDAV